MVEVMAEQVAVGVATYPAVGCKDISAELVGCAAQRERALSKRL